MFIHAGTTLHLQSYNLPKGWSGFDSKRFHTVSRFAVVNSLISSLSVNGYGLPLTSALSSPKTGSVTPDNIVARLGPEYGNVEPSECFTKISD